jgi:hypothetical protein
MAEVLTFFGYTGDPDPCQSPDVGAADDIINVGPTFKTGLANFAPNPLLGGATGRIQFTMGVKGQAAIDIFDVNGRLVKTVFDGIADQGPNEAFWNGSDYSGRQVASGVYFYQLRANQDQYSKKMVVVRNGN